MKCDPDPSELLSDDGSKSTTSSSQDDHLEEMLQRKKDKRIELLHRISAVREKRDQVKRQIKSLTKLNTTWIQLYNQATLEKYTAISNYTKKKIEKKEREDELSKLQKIHVLQDVFHLWHRGSYATINGLRLGMTSIPPLDQRSKIDSNTSFWNNSGNLMNGNNNTVPWHEINAALGMVALLMQTLQKNLRIEHQSRYEILPRGSNTIVSSRKTKQEWELFHQPTTFQFFSKRNWNAALNILGFCLYELACEMTRLSKHVDGENVSNPLETPPFDVKLEDDWSNERIGIVKVGGLQIAYNDGADWSKVMRYVAIDLKMMIAFVSKNIE